MSSENSYILATNNTSYRELTNKYLNSIKGYQQADTLAGKVNKTDCTSKFGISLYSDIINKCLNSVQGDENMDTLAGKVNVSSIKRVSDSQSILEAYMSLQHKL